MKCTGMVFDIQRFCLHDGLGIRTTVFLKGCPLSCAWCHNPESQSPYKQLSYDESHCIHCMQCVDSCQNGAHKAVNARHCVDFSACESAGACVETCNNNALKIIGRQISVCDVLAEVKKDIRYYGETGGITLSGGEPMSQFEFSLELCKQAKQAGMHTCVETCGYASKKQFEAILPYVDLFLYDYKETDPQKHKLFTGVTNEIILENLGFLHDSQAGIIVRVPVIPDFNDTKEHFTGIAELSTKYPRIQGIELLAYHNFGKSKAKNIGRNYDVKAKSVGEDKKQEYLSVLINSGCNKNLLLK